MVEICEFDENYKLTDSGSSKNLKWNKHRGNHIKVHHNKTAGK